MVVVVVGIFCVDLFEVLQCFMKGGIDDIWSYGLVMAVCSLFFVLRIDGK